MTNNIVDAVREAAQHITEVSSFAYEGRRLINSQPNRGTVEVTLENDIFTEYLVTQGKCKTTLNVDILANVYEVDKEEDKHDLCTRIAVLLVKLMNKHYSTFNVYDFSILQLSHFTDNDQSGVRLTMYVIMPSLLDACDLEDMVDDGREFEEAQDNEITLNIPNYTADRIKLNPIRINPTPNGKC